MILKQYYLGCLAHASYLIADERTRKAVVVDPQRDVEQYLEDAAQEGWEITQVILTHFHADFLAGHIELRNRMGAKIVMGARAQAEFEFQAMRDGDEIRLGDVRLVAMETPGHTPEGLSILVYNDAADRNRPHAVLTGDTLFIGDVGRPDLLASIGVTADELAEMLFHSVERLRALPDETLVYPAHGAGSMCGKNLSKETVSTIGEQKRSNYALQPMSLDRFRALVTVDQPEAPEYFVYDAIRNRQEREDLETTMKESLRPLELSEVLQLQAQGAQLVDVREAAEFEAAHLAGAINIGLQGKYATWCGSVLSHDKPIVVIAEEGGEEEATMRLGRIGFDRVVGHLKGGMRAAENRPEVVRTIERITARDLAAVLPGPDAPLVLDVRTEKERKASRIVGSVGIPLAKLESRISELPQGRRIAVHCEGGYRSAIAASLLARAGHHNLVDLIGGIKAWIASDLPVEVEEPSTCGTTCGR